MFLKILEVTHETHFIKFSEIKIIEISNVESKNEWYKLIIYLKTPKNINESQEIYETYAITEEYVENIYSQIEMYNNLSE